MHTLGDIDLQVDPFAMFRNICHPYSTSVLLCVPRYLKYLLLRCCSCLSIIRNVLPNSK